MNELYFTKHCERPMKFDRFELKILFGAFIGGWLISFFQF